MRTAAVRFVLALLMCFLLAPDSGASSPDLQGPDLHGSAAGTPADRLPDAGPAHSAYATCGTPDRGGEPNGVLRHRDRHRSATVPAPEAPSRSAVAAAAGGMLTTAAVAAMGNAHHTSRSSTAHSTSLLQVFRC